MKVTLLIVVAMLVAGCTGGKGYSGSDLADAKRDARQDGYGEGHAAGYAEAEALYNPPTTIVAERLSRSTIDVENGTHAAFHFNLTGEGEAEWNLAHYAGPAVDVLLLRASEYEDYAAGDPFDWDPDGSDLAAETVTRTTGLQAGSFVLVLDNTAAALPVVVVDDDDVARLRFQFTVKQAA